MAKAPAKTAKKKSFKKKEKKRVSTSGIVHMQASFNNTIVTITDPDGQRARLVELRFARVSAVRARARPFAAQQAALTAANKAKECGLARRWKFVSAGPGSGRESAVRALVDRRDRSAGDQGRHADSAQRLPSAEEAPRLSLRDS